MDWIQRITNAIRYMESNLTNDISIEGVSDGDDPFDTYVFTRDQILGGGTIIPFPKACRTAVQFMGGESKKGQYCFSYIVGAGGLA